MTRKFKSTRVSILLPVYNRTKYLSQSLLSVSADLGPNDEVIIIDDGSEIKNSHAIKKMISDFGVQFSYYKIKNSGPSGALNYGLSLAKGKYISTFSSDDIMLKGHISSGLKTLNKGFDFSFSYPIGIDEDGKFSKLGVNELFSDKNNGPEVSSRDHAQELFFEGNYFCAPSMIVKKSILQKLDGFNLGYLQLQDFDIILRATLSAYSVVINPTPTIGYMMDSKNNNLSSSVNNARIELERNVILKNVLSGLTANQLSSIFPLILGNRFFKYSDDISRAHLLMSHKNREVKLSGLEVIISHAKTVRGYEEICSAYELGHHELNEWITLTKNWFQENGLK